MKKIILTWPVLLAFVGLLMSFFTAWTMSTGPRPISNDFWSAEKLSLVYWAAVYAVVCLIVVVTRIISDKNAAAQKSGRCPSCGEAVAIPDYPDSNDRCPYCGETYGVYGY